MPSIAQRVVSRFVSKLASKLKCNMQKDCDKPVTHINVNKGYVYCTFHANQLAAAGRPNRKIRPGEFKKLEENEAEWGNT